MAAGLVPGSFADDTACALMQQPLLPIDGSETRLRMCSRTALLSTRLAVPAGHSAAAGVPARHMLQLAQGWMLNMLNNVLVPS